MSETMEFVLLAVLIGVGATAVLDLWTAFSARISGVPGPNWAMVGRWLGHFPSGRFVHESIGRASPIRGELALGWVAHYVIGIVFAGILLAIWGLEWARHPSLWPALVIGILTLAAPFLLMQPAMGAGIAASRMPNPNAARLRSLVAHLVFGFGLYCSGLLVAALIG
jgi:hypothetical protein